MENFRNGQRKKFDEVRIDQWNKVRISQWSGSELASGRARIV